MIACASILSVVKSAVRAGQLAEQRGEHPVLRIQRLLERLDAIHDRLEPPSFCGVHGPTAESRKSIAVAVNDVDITGALGNALF